MPATPRTDEALGTYLDGCTVSHAGPGSAVATGTVRRTFPGFEGHFPGRPILAGAFQVDMLALLARDVVPAGWSLALIGHARFRRVVLPGDRVEMEVSSQPAGGSDLRVRASMVSQGGKACVATLVFRSGPAG